MPCALMLLDAAMLDIADILIASPMLTLPLFSMPAAAAMLPVCPLMPTPPLMLFIELSHCYESLPALRFFFCRLLMPPLITTCRFADDDLASFHIYFAAAR